MFLKSTPAASSISDPAGRFGLNAFNALEDRPPAGDLHPVAIEDFIRYGEWFQKSCAPELERTVVRRIDSDPAGFRVELETDEVFTSHRVVMATGLGPYAYVAPEFVPLVEAGVASHPSAHDDLSRFAGQRVAVVGAGQSALESAVLLHEAGALPTVVARAHRILFGDPPAGDSGRDRPLPTRLAKPWSSLGPGWSLYGFANAPAWFRLLPEDTRHRLVKTVLGPSGGWWLRERYDGRIDTLAGYRVTAVAAGADSARLTLRGEAGTIELEADHVLVATGYRVDVDRLTLLSPEIRRAVRRTRGAPLLGADFQASVPGLYFTGLSAAATFGPVQRFVAGTGFAARTISAAVAGGTGGRRR
ncbi:hypothetical protein GCM10023235_59670 [Kitasatospora terrestris]|uniref:L-lysine N6-monooxygenase MbtG n=2 Tax=Kitasatospora terrestris TaxID=258051 RepID=A0ABP9EHI4_9ACTN